MDDRIVVTEREIVDHPGPQVVGKVSRPPLSRASTAASVSGARISSQMLIRSRAPSANASRMPSTSTVIGSVPGGIGSPKAGTVSLPCTSTQRSS